MEVCAMINIQPTKEKSKQYYPEYGLIGCTDCIYAKDQGAGYECTKDGGPKFFMGSICLYSSNHKHQEKLK
jgi:hypothetical protein